MRLAFNFDVFSGSAQRLRVGDTITNTETINDLNLNTNIFIAIDNKTDELQWNGDIYNV